MFTTMSKDIKFVDIMEPRRAENSVFQFMTRPWNPQRSLVNEKHYSPQDLRDTVAASVYMDAVIEAESLRTGINKEIIKKEVLKYLNEMGLEKKLFVIRWMGVFFLKVSFMMKIGVFVNETAVLKLRSSMGDKPVLFLPTHRSYADFCLMTYLCYHYDIDFPAVAAGMDFYSMAIVGRSMRDTCAFYIRRTLAGDQLYAATLRQYVRTLVAKHCAPIEFFLEGTRSRSNKSLPPKYGMLSMSLVPLFAGEVSDITIVPVNISYDRLMEHSLFAYEHIGVPKPKESTGSLLKSLHNLNDHFGNIYINLGDPLSVKEYLKQNIIHSNEMLKPADLQQLTPDQFAKVQDIANHVVTLQQKSTVATITNLVALVLMQSVIKNTPLSFEEVIAEVEWMITVLRQLRASVFENEVKSSVERILVVHNKMMKIDKNGKLVLISNMPINLSNDVKNKMKGHTLRASTLTTAVPLIQLQLYVNPVLHCLAPAALVCLLARTPRSAEQLTSDYHSIRKLLKHEFFFVGKDEETTFNNAIEYCFNHSVISSTGNSWILAPNEKLQFLLKWSLWPALATMSKSAEVLREQNKCEHKQVLKLIQERVEESQCHPYCLSLEATANCIQGLVLAGAVSRERTNENTLYEVNPEAMEKCYNLVNSVLPDISVDFGKTNSVILDPRIVPSRL